MNRLAFAATLVLPSLALAHPGHSHVGMSSNHHLVEAAVVAAVAAGGYVLARVWRRKRGR